MARIAFRRSLGGRSTCGALALLFLGGSSSFAASPRCVDDAVCREADGEILSMLDNPRLLSDVELSGTEKLECGLTETVSTDWRLLIDFDSESNSYDIGASSAYSVCGVLDAGEGHVFQNGVATLETTGLQLGTKSVPLRTTKRFKGASGGSEEILLSSDKIRLDDDVIIVPVSVVVAKSPEQEPEQVALSFEKAQLLFDDVPYHSAVTQGAYASVTELDTAFRDQQVNEITRPDAIFAQCGIQFRMVEYAAVPTVGHLLVGTASLLGNDPSCATETVDFFNAHYAKNLSPGFPDEDFTGIEQISQYYAADGASTYCPVADNGAYGEQVIPRAKWIAAQSRVSAFRIGPIGVGYGRSMFDARGVFSGTFRYNVPLTLNHSGPIVVIAEGISSSTVIKGVSDEFRYAFIGRESRLETLGHELGHVLGAGHLPDGVLDGLMSAAGDEGRSGTAISGCSLWRAAGLPPPPGCSETAYASNVANCDVLRAKALTKGFSVGDGDLGNDLWFKLESGLNPKLSWVLGKEFGAPKATYVSGNSTDGVSAIAAPGGYTEITSPAFRTADLNEIGTELAVDVFVPVSPPDPWWVGSVSIASENIAASSYQYLGIQDLTGLARGAWTTLTFSVPEGMREVLLGDWPAQRLSLIVNTPSGPSDVLLDNLRFAGSISKRSLGHQSAVDTPVRTNGFLSFEVDGDWTSASGTATRISGPATHGSSTLRVDSGGWVPVVSRWFSTEELPVVSSTIALDVFIPDPQPNPWWVGDIHVYVNCPSAGVYNAWVGRQSLTNLFVGEFNHLNFSLPENVRVALEQPNVCTLELALNAGGESSPFLFDRVGFE